MERGIALAGVVAEGETRVAMLVVDVEGERPSLSFFFRSPNSLLFSFSSGVRCSSVKGSGFAWSSGFELAKVLMLKLD